MSNIIDKIRVSGTVYTLSATSSGGSPTVELTQAEYDALVSAGTVSADTYYIITDAQAGDLTQYWTSAQTNSAITQAVSGKANSSDVYTKSETSGATEIATALSGKQDTLSAGTNITIVDNVISATGGGGGGKAIEAGTNISVVTGETADTINCTLPIYISSDVDRGDINIGTNNNANSNYYKIAIGRKIDMSQAQGGGSIVIATPTNSTAFYNKCYGGSNVGIGRNIQIGESNSYSGAKHNCVAIGREVKSLISQSVAIGYHAVTSGTTKTNINNQLTIDTSNQVYIYNKDNTEMICLQDHLGGGGGITSGEVQSMIDESISGKADSSAVTQGISAAVSGKLDTSTFETYSGNVETALSGKQDTLSAGTGISIVDNVISATGGGGGGMSEDDELLLATALTDLNDRKADKSEVREVLKNYQRKGDYVTTNTLNTRLAEYETALDEQNVEEVTAYALNDLNERFGGLRIVKITESEYAALTTKDENTLYVVVADPT